MPGPTPRPPHYARDSSPPRRYHPDSVRPPSEDEDYARHPPRYNHRNLDHQGFSFGRGEQVEVRIRGNVWIVGLIVSGLHLLSTCLRQGYDIEYKDSRTSQFCVGSFPIEDVRPYA